MNTIKIHYIHVQEQIKTSQRRVSLSPADSNDVELFLPLQSLNLFLLCGKVFPQDRELNLIVQNHHLTDHRDTLPSQRASLHGAWWLFSNGENQGLVLYLSGIATCTVISSNDTAWQVCRQEILALCECHRVHMTSPGVTKSCGASSMCNPLLAEAGSWTTWLYMNVCARKCHKAYHSA